MLLRAVDVGVTGSPRAGGVAWDRDFYGTDPIHEVNPNLPRVDPVPPSYQAGIQNPGSFDCLVATLVSENDIHGDQEWSGILAAKDFGFGVQAAHPYHFQSAAVYVGTGIVFFTLLIVLRTPLEIIPFDPRRVEGGRC